MTDNEISITLTGETMIFQRHTFVPGMLIQWCHSNIDNARVIENDKDITMIIDAPDRIGLILHVRETDGTLFGDELTILDASGELLQIFSAFSTPL